MRDRHMSTRIADSITFTIVSISGIPLLTAAAVGPFSVGAVRVLMTNVLLQVLMIR